MDRPHRAPTLHLHRTETEVNFFGEIVFVVVRNDSIDMMTTTSTSTMTTTTTSTMTTTSASTMPLLGPIPIDANGSFFQMLRSKRSCVVEPFWKWLLKFAMMTCGLYYKRHFKIVRYCAIVISCGVIIYGICDNCVVIYNHICDISCVIIDDKVIFNVWVTITLRA